MAPAAPANPLRGVTIDSAYVAGGKRDPGVELAINPARLHDAFAADLPVFTFG